MKKSFGLIVYRFENNYNVGDSYKFILTIPKKAKDYLMYCFLDSFRHNYDSDGCWECDEFEEDMNNGLAEIDDFNKNNGYAFGDDEIFARVEFLVCNERKDNKYYLMYATRGTTIVCTKLFDKKKDVEREIKRLNKNNETNNFTEIGYLPISMK